VAGELAPKGIALQHPEATTLWVARPLQLFYVVFRWPITALNAVGNWALRMIGLRSAAGHEMVHTAEELALLVETSRRAGVVEKSEARIASKAFQFADLTAGDLMTPRTELEGIALALGREALLARVAATPHSHLPVYDGSLDDILGVIRARDLVSLLVDPGVPFDVRSLIRPVLIVPESRRADDLLEDMRKALPHFAVVVDEYGGTAGVVTLSDLMRALVGPIDEESTAQPPGVVSQPDGSFLVDGLIRLHELEELLGIELDEVTRATVATVGGLIMAKLDRIPRLDDEVTVPGYRLRVERLDGRRVSLVRARRVPLERRSPIKDDPAAAPSRPLGSGI
jgi:CBS domain containing-hemolysin-like protein